MRAAFSGRGHPLLVAAATLLFLELAARALAPALPPQEWGNHEIDSRVAQMEAIWRRETDIGLVFAGNSVAGAGFDPAVFEQMTGVHAYNASIGGSSPQLISHWLAEIVEPLVEPEMVAIGLTSGMINGGNPGHGDFLGSYLTSPGRARFLHGPDLGDRVEARLSEFSAFIRIRHYVRNPQLVLDIIRTGGEIGIGPGGERTVRGHVGYRPERFEAGTRQALTAFAIGTEEIQALMGVTDQLRSRGVRVVLVLMPVVEEDYVPLHPGGEDDYRAFLEAMGAVGSSIEVFDARHVAKEPRYFYDFYHLNEEGSELFTRLIAEELAPGSGWGGGQGAGLPDIGLEPHTVTIPGP